MLTAGERRARPAGADPRVEGRRRVTLSPSFTVMHDPMEGEGTRRCSTVECRAEQEGRW